MGWRLNATALLDITDPSAVRRAIHEFDDLGRDVFLARHGFKPARKYFLVFGGKQYDSKAIIGVAHGYQFPKKGPLRAADFSGGDATVKTRLESLGYTVESDNDSTGGSDKQYTSASLNVEEVYSRERLSELFGIRDATLNTGLFRPKGYHSLWIFLTETKTSDRTLYENRLTESAAYFQSQTLGCKDELLMEHESLEIELLVFYRKSKFEFPKAGFRYEGYSATLATRAGIREALFCGVSKTRLGNRKSKPIRRGTSTQKVLKMEVFAFPLRSLFVAGNELFDHDFFTSMQDGVQLQVSIVSML